MIEKRFIQKTGGSSYTITLPKHWVESNNIQHKDAIEIFCTLDGQLCLRPSAKNHILEASLTIDVMTNEEITREVIGFYVSGCSQINLLGNPIASEQRVLVRNLLYKLVGFEIFESTSSKISLIQAAKPMISMRDYIDRMFAIINSMMEDLIQVFEVRNPVLIKDIIERDVEVDRIHLILIRRLNVFITTLFPPESASQSYSFPGDPTSQSLSTLHHYEHIAARLERIADHVVRVASTLNTLSVKDKYKIAKPEFDEIKRITHSFRDCMEMVMNDDKEIAHSLLDAYDKIQKNAYIKRHRILQKESIDILILDSVERIRSYIANLAEETIDNINMRDLRLASNQE